MHNEHNLIWKTVLENNLKEIIQITGKHKHLSGHLSREKPIIHIHPHTQMSELFPFNALLLHQELGNFLTELDAPNPPLCSLELRKHFSGVLEENKHHLYNKKKKKTKKK